MGAYFAPIRLLWGKKRPSKAPTKGKGTRKKFVLSWAFSANRRKIFRLERQILGTVAALSGIPFGFTSERVIHTDGSVPMGRCRRLFSFGQTIWVIFFGCEIRMVLLDGFIHAIFRAHDSRNFKRPFAESAHECQIYSGLLCISWALLHFVGAFEHSWAPTDVHSAHAL